MPHHPAQNKRIIKNSWDRFFIPVYIVEMYQIYVWQLPVWQLGREGEKGLKAGLPQQILYCIYMYSPCKLYKKITFIKFIHENAWKSKFLRA